MDIINLLISLVSGAVGGNVAGAVMKEKSLGVVGNSIAGIFGGGVGNAILSLLGLFGTTAATGDHSIGSIIGNIAGSGVGGAILLFIVSLIKNAVAKKT